MPLNPDSDLLTSTAYPARVKYTTAAAARYQARRTDKHEAEMRLVAKAFRHVPPGRVLDVPCGGGRISRWLAEQGHSVTAADLSPAMLSVARKNLQGALLPVAVETQDIESLTHPGENFDAVICFRFFHHLPTPASRARVVRELCRVARNHVVISYFSMYSATFIKRAWQRWLRGKQTQHFATSLRELRGYFAENEFRLARNYARCPLIHSLYLAVFERT